MDSQQDKVKNTKSTKAIVTMGILIVIVLVAGFSIILKQMAAAPAPEGPTVVNEGVGNYVIDESNLEEIKDEMAEKMEEGMFSTEMNLLWHFPTAKEPSSDAYVGNSEANNSPVFFEIYLADTQELVYTSTVLPVGSKLKELKLDRELAVGEYEAVCKFNLLDEEGNKKSDVSVAVTLIIEG